MNKVDYLQEVELKLEELKQVDFLDLIYSEVYSLYTKNIKPPTEETREISFNDLSNFVKNVSYEYKDLHRYAAKLMERVEAQPSKELRLEKSILKMTEYFYRQDDINLAEITAMQKYQQMFAENNPLQSIFDIKNKNNQ